MNENLNWFSLNWFDAWFHHVLFFLSFSNEQLLWYSIVVETFQISGLVHTFIYLRLLDSRVDGVVVAFQMHLQKQKF